MTETPLDRALRAVAASPENETLRRNAYGRLLASEVFLLLDRAAEGETIAPRVFPLEEGPIVLAFDGEDRLAAFAGGPAPYAGISGRALVALLAGQGLGLGLNLDEADGAFLIAGSTVDWLAETKADAAVSLLARPKRLLQPEGVARALLDGLDQRLAAEAGQARAAYLARAEYVDGVTGLLLVLIDPIADSLPGFAQMAAEAAQFSGAEGAALDVIGVPGDDPLLAVLDRVGLRFDLPEPVQTLGPKAPGQDPEKPPRLK